MLLSACSSYFKDLFKENPCQHPVIIFRNVTHDDLMALVDFMYNGEVNVEQEQLASFLHTAELLQVQGLTNSNKDSETKTKKTAKQQDDRVPAPEVQFDEDGHPSPYQSDERTSTPTRTGPPAAKKRKWQSPSRTASPAEVQAIAQVSAGANSGGEGEEGESHQMDEVPLKTEPDYDDDDDEQASGADDAVEEQESIIAKIQKSDQLILTTSTSRSRASNSDHSLFGGNVMDMLSTSESGDMSNFVMAGPSNESMGQEGIQGSKAHSFHSMASKFITHEVQEGTLPRFTCKLCGKSFNHRDSCQKHMAIHFGTSKCYICGYVLSRKSHMKRHLRHVHGIPSGDAFLKYVGPLDSSTLKVIMKDGAFSCSVCDRRFLNKSSCVRHFATHLGKTTCSICHKSFGHEDALKQHFAVHLGTTTCPVCQRKFGREFYLKVHLEQNEFMYAAEPDATAADLRVIEKDGKFYCSACERKYKNRSSCVRHFDFHLGRTTCSVCFKVFDTLVNLKAHFPFHLGSTTCQLCGKQLCNMTQLKYHMDHVHLKRSRGDQSKKS
ncbi:Hypothetical predicted protein [Cloeon dipterum]|uniref:BTB domain-containing protein n=1 Tax=Cloeon dipterum TaxID=197152 RepID=A0A8S1CB70_9INSE|nr:Hypothetical predicted protein [Cloeon dipterum]